MFFFGKNKKVPSYVDWLKDDYGFEGTQSEGNLPWTNQTTAHGREDHSWFEGLNLEAGGPAELSVPWTPSFLTKVAGKIPNPIGFTLRFISLTIVPLFFTGIVYLLFRYFMEWSKYSSLAVTLVGFFVVLRHAATRVSDRPSLVEVLRFFFHEAALAWLMWIFGSMVYTLVLEHVRLFVALATFAGLLTAGVVYFFAAARINRRYGAHKCLSYLAQVGSIIAMTAIGLIAGYSMGQIIWEVALSEPGPPYANYIMAMFFAFVTFWISVKQFYIRTHTQRGATSLDGRGSDIRA